MTDADAKLLDDATLDVLAARYTAAPSPQFCVEQACRAPMRGNERLTDPCEEFLCSRWGDRHDRRWVSIGDDDVLAAVAEVRRLRGRDHASCDSLISSLAVDRDSERMAHETANAEVRRLRAEIDCGSDSECELDAPGGDECRKHAIESAGIALARADRYAAVLAHIEALGFHAAACSQYGRESCTAACPTETAKRAREEPK